MTYRGTRMTESTWWTAHAPGRTIEGYASSLGVLAGGRLDLHVSTTPAARYRVTVHRLGWYGGSGGRELIAHPRSGDLVGLARDMPDVMPGPQVASASWPITDSIPIPRDAPSGLYLARLELTDGEHAGSAAKVPFVVRPEPWAPMADVLVQMPVTTMQAYNNWGGKSLYVSNSTDGEAAVKVTFDRPVPAWHDANLNARWPFIWDLQLVRFLEREGYDVAYTTDLATHQEPWSLLGHPLLVTSGHDEYWTAEMRDGFEDALAAGASLFCAGSNTCYWQMRLENEGRTMVEYRRREADPEPDPARKTILFRDLVPPRPEHEILGVAYQDGMTPPGQPPRHYALNDSAAGDPWLDGTGFEAGAVLEGLVGYEWDALVRGHAPPDATVFFHYEHETSNADAVRHRRPEGGIVFASGSLQFSWGLDDWGHPGHVDERLQRFMHNALDEMISAGRPARPRR
jgi:hypothetical protein